MDAYEFYINGEHIFTLCCNNEMLLGVAKRIGFTRVNGMRPDVRVKDVHAGLWYELRKGKFIPIGHGEQVG
jgi:hypothetical protein